ncbi:MAG: 4Fe-4S binding protein [Defluviitaleaceae bacterium]|nr:4Fe-4S binding protein [Defluviitaleaceae bacterium]
MSNDTVLKMRTRAREMLASGEVTQVLAWEAGEFPNYPAPAFFKDENACGRILYDRFCTANLSKFMIEASRNEGKTLVFLRPCDAYSLTQLIKENQVNREKAYIIGVGCEGCVTVYEGEECGLLESCLVCIKTDYPIYDELIGTENNPRTATTGTERFEGVTRVEETDASARYGFWQTQLSRCIRCNACRNICPTCHCKVCMLDKESLTNPPNPLENKFFHVIRAYHQNGRCTDCGQCARVCPQGIPLQLLNRKLIKAYKPVEVQP